MFQEQRMRDRRQRSALTACGDVTWAKIGDGGNSRSFGDDCRLGNLESGTNGADSRRMDTMWKMMQGLAMRADQCDITRLQIRLSNDV